jgi:hypothetical protein
MSGIGTATTFETFLFLGFAAAALLAYLADVITTMIGTSKGLVEGNPLMKWLFSKVGESFAGWLGGVAVLFIGGILSNYTLRGSEVFFSGIAAAESVQAFLNYRKIKALK